MSLNIKNKVRLGTLFLFLLLALSGLCSVYYLVALKNVSSNILKNNYESLLYCRDMQLALDNAQAGVAFNAAAFDTALAKEESNLTEYGEKEAAANLRMNYLRWRGGDTSMQRYSMLKKYIATIQLLNMQAIEKKNLLAGKSSESATTVIIIIVAVTLLLGISFAYNFPFVITTPIKKLTAAIQEISKKNYTYKIHEDSRDEFGQLAALFNEMTDRLQGFESSNLNKIIYEKNRAEAVINSLKDASIGIDKENRVLFANQQALQLLNCPQDKVIGRPVIDIIKENDLFGFLVNNESNNPFKIVLEGKENFYTREVFEVSQGAMYSKVIVVRNITSFKEMDVAKTNFIATISHELKTPLSSSDFSLKLLEDDRVGQMNDEQKGLVVQLKNDNQRMLRILSELLNMAQVEAGRLQFDMQQADPYRIIENSYLSLVNVAKVKDVTIQKNISEGLPLLRTDTDRAVWVLNNLLSNAIKFSPPGSTVSMNLEQKQTHLLFSVTDHGPGIEAKYLDKIFERYFRVPGRFDKKEGSGIGLAICKDFIEAMGGKMWVESEPGKGSTFGFTLGLGNT